jgi:hypothetical protein
MSKKKNDDDMPVTFPEKWLKVLKQMPEFKEIADSSDAVGLKKIIVESEGNIYTTEKDMEADSPLNGAKDLVKQYSAAYKEAMKFQTAKIKYAMFLLEGNGEAIGNDDTKKEE